ncbi:hypothetical protein JOM56_008985 [Amanita muscaria]
MSQPPSLRRIVTRHNEQGVAVVVSDITIDGERYEKIFRYNLANPTPASPATRVYAPSHGSKNYYSSPSANFLYVDPSYAEHAITGSTQTIFRFEIGDAYLGAVSRSMSNVSEYSDVLLPQSADGSPVEIESNQPYLNLAMFRMVVFADEILEAFFWSTARTEQVNKKMFTDEIGKTISRHQVIHRPSAFNVATHNRHGRLALKDVSGPEEIGDVVGVEVVATAEGITELEVVEMVVVMVAVADTAVPTMAEDTATGYGGGGQGWCSGKRPLAPTPIMLSLSLFLSCESCLYAYEMYW